LIDRPVEETTRIAEQIARLRCRSTLLDGPDDGKNVLVGDVRDRPFTPHWEKLFGHVA
jgi:hypothetical protein